MHVVSFPNQKGLSEESDSGLLLPPGEADSERGEVVPKERLALSSSDEDDFFRRRLRLPLGIKMGVEVRRERVSSGIHTGKLAILVWLSVQNAVHTLLLRYSRVRDVPEMFFSSVAVFWMEVLKVGMCLTMIYFNESTGLKSFTQLLKKQVLDHPVDTLKVCIPALLYTVQNNLFYVAASHLDAATFMIVSQLKIFSTALFSIVLLNRTLAKSQWVSLAVLFVGVCLVQLQPQSASKTPMSQSAGQSRLIGFTAACIACTTSGLAGVYFEKILKGSAPVSLWMRNIQMAVFAVPSSLAASLVQDWGKISRLGFMYGFDSVVWFTVLWYGIGGLSVAVCIKYADNIAKNFATAVAILLATMGSVYLFGFHPSFLFTMGATLVIFSIFLYSSASTFLAYFGSQRVGSHATLLTKL